MCARIACCHRQTWESQLPGFNHVTGARPAKSAMPYRIEPQNYWSSYNAMMIRRACEMQHKCSTACLLSMKMHYPRLLVPRLCNRTPWLLLMSKVCKSL